LLSPPIQALRNLLKCLTDEQFETEFQVERQRRYGNVTGPVGNMDMNMNTSKKRSAPNENHPMTAAAAARAALDENDNQDDDGGNEVVVVGEKLKTGEQSYDDEDDEDIAAAIAATDAAMANTQQQLAATGTSPRKNPSTSTAAVTAAVRVRYTKWDAKWDVMYKQLSDFRKKAQWLHCSAPDRRRCHLHHHHQ
jgi:hypothetical protein